MTCMGCDGQPTNCKVCDRCDHCKGHSCGCLQIYGLPPRSGPVLGGTRISVQSAGFLVNSSSSSAGISSHHALAETCECSASSDLCQVLEEHRRGLIG